MQIVINDKDLEKLIKNIDSLLGKITRFNLCGPCTLNFIFNKVTSTIHPIISHNIIQDLNYKFYLNDRKLISSDEENQFLTNDSIKKFMEKIDPLSISHNVILSTTELDLSLKRNDLYLYSDSIIIYIPNKFKEFLSYKLIEEIEFEFNESNNTFNIKNIKLYDSQNPITQRQKSIYLSNPDIPMGYFSDDRKEWLSENIIKLCELSNQKIEEPSDFYITYDVKNKSISDLDEWKYTNYEGIEIRLPGEFLKANPKLCESWYIKEKIKGVDILSILNHISYNTKMEQYIFYRYYAI